MGSPTQERVEQAAKSVAQATALLVAAAKAAASSATPVCFLMLQY